MLPETSNVFTTVVSGALKVSGSDDGPVTAPRITSTWASAGHELRPVRPCCWVWILIDQLDRLPRRTVETALPRVKPRVAGPALRSRTSSRVDQAAVVDPDPAGAEPVA